MPRIVKKNVRQNKKRINKKVKKAVRSYPRQIQNASYLPKSRLVKFTDFRSFVVQDEGFNTSGALPPVLEIASNNPRKFIHGKQGTWDANSLTAKGNAVPGIANFITNLVPGTDDKAPYLNGSCLSCRVVVTATPIPTVPAVGSEQDTYQDVIKMCVQNNTRNGMMSNKNISNTFNSEIVSQTPYVRTANLYYNHNGTPRGATVSINYSFKKQNAGRPMLNAQNFFHADTDPSEKDFINIAFLPTHSQRYGLATLGGERLPNMRVEVKVSYIVLLSEPNGHVSTSAVNDGLNMANIPTVADLLTPPESQTDL